MQQCIFYILSMLFMKVTKVLIWFYEGEKTLFSLFSLSLAPGSQIHWNFCDIFIAGLPEPPIFDISGSGQIPAPTPTSTLLHFHSFSPILHSYSYTPTPKLIIHSYSYTPTKKEKPEYNQGSDYVRFS